MGLRHKYYLTPSQTKFVCKLAKVHYLDVYPPNPNFANSTRDALYDDSILLTKQDLANSTEYNKSFIRVSLSKRGRRVLRKNKTKYHKCAKIQQIASHVSAISWVLLILDIVGWIVAACFNNLDPSGDICFIIGAIVFLDIPLFDYVHSYLALKRLTRALKHTLKNHRK